jgi:hypothetical protein
VLSFLKVIVIDAKCRFVSTNVTPYQDRYAIVIRRHPEIILVVDRSLTRGWTTARMMHPDIGPEDLAFRTLPDKEFDAMPE